MAINRKLLIRGAVVVAALFLVANPLGDAHHGMGRHSTLAADLGQALFVASLLGAVLLVVLAMTALVQFARRSRNVDG
jgi:hypothetical protein